MRENIQLRFQRTHAKKATNQSDFSGICPAPHENAGIF